MSREYKIPHELSSDIYSVFVKVLNIPDDFFERESFIYHHSIVDHDILEYEMPLGTYSLTISKDDDKVRRLADIDISSSNTDELIKKANKIINWKIKKYANISTAI
tara:strand:- start:1600 stop:1917 length:318 start_codon:yes stop_codon:yes gene_type:complete